MQQQSHQSIVEHHRSPFVGDHFDVSTSHSFPFSNCSSILIIDPINLHHQIKNHNNNNDHEHLTLILPRKESMITIQIGLLAATTVLLLPMLLAGYHLSRNKMLFFSLSLFISLAVLVHLSPYFPSLKSSLFQTPTPISCFHLLHNINFWPKPNSSHWAWAQPNDPNVITCGFQKLGRRDTIDLLNGSWVMVVGDSQSRLFVLSVLSLVLLESDMGPVRKDLFKRHSDYSLVVDGGGDRMGSGFKLDFVWAPYVGNLTSVVEGLSRNGSFPDVVVMGSGLWHMLHVNNYTDYGVELEGLVRSVMMMSLMDSGSGGRLVSRPHLFWLGMPVLVNSMLNTEEKRERMSGSMQFAYDRGVQRSKLVRPDGPFVLLDVRSLSGSCGVECTEDGMHYDGVVYDAAVQIMLNALVIQSQQKL